MCREYGWWQCPAVPPGMVLLPTWFYFNLYEMSSWSRDIVVPLSIVWALRPGRPVAAGQGIAELRVRPVRARVPGGASRFWRAVLLVLDRALNTRERLPPSP